MIQVDTHTHSIASGHAFSTIIEMAKDASERGIKMFCLTDHAPALPGSPHLWYFGNMKIIPAELFGTRIIKGVELNILNYRGEVDLPKQILKNLDYAIASYHDVCIQPDTVENHTAALEILLANPYVDAIAHPGNPQFNINIEKIVKTAVKENKALEINNHSPVARSGSEKNCEDILAACKEFGCRIVTGSDAHICFDIGKFNFVYELIQKVNFPEELILTASTERFLNFLGERKKRMELMKYIP